MHNKEAVLPKVRLIQQIHMAHKIYLQKVSEM